jgi:hypothetical protein
MNARKQRYAEAVEREWETRTVSGLVEAVMVVANAEQAELMAENERLRRRLEMTETELEASVTRP